MAILVAFQPYMDVNNPRLEDIKKIEQQLVTLSPQQVPSLLKAKDKKAVMLVLYASWCGYCNVELPKVLQLIADHKLDDVTPVFMSLDEQPRLLSKYLLYKHYDAVFQPYYRVDQGILSSLSGALVVTGSHYEGGIPYIGFFDKDGKMVAEQSGMLDKRGLLQMASTLKD